MQHLTFAKILMIFLFFFPCCPRGPPTCIKRNVEELQVCASSNFQLRTTLGAEKNTKKRKSKKILKTNERTSRGEAPARLRRYGYGQKDFRPKYFPPKNVRPEKKGRQKFRNKCWTKNVQPKNLRATKFWA